MPNKIKEIVVLSGKGGTGKTTFAASLIPYLDNILIADCDVDVPDLDILLEPELVNSEDFIGMAKVFISRDFCIKCGLCFDSCRFDAITEDYQVQPQRCEGCGVCEYICPQEAVTLKQTIAGQILHSNTLYGMLLQGRLVPGEETSGKLVSAVRRKAKDIAEKNGKEFLLIDGSPGIGCSVISSVTGADLIILVTEPSESGFYDLKRVVQMVNTFGIPMVMVVNKWDLSHEKTNEMEEFARKAGIIPILRIPFTNKIVKAIVNRNIPSVVLKNEYDSWGMEECVKIIREL